MGSATSVRIRDSRLVYLVHDQDQGLTSNRRGSGARLQKRGRASQPGSTLLCPSAQRRSLPRKVGPKPKFRTPAASRAKKKSWDMEDMEDMEATPPWCDETFFDEKAEWWDSPEGSLWL